MAAHKNDDFDEFCDANDPKTIRFEKIMDANDRVRPFVLNSPLVPSKYQRDFVIRLYYKLEFLQKTGSFKERGAVNALQLLTMDKRKIGVVIASLGNFGASFCYHAQKMNVPVTVVMPVAVPLAKIQKCQSFGAQVYVHGNNLMDSQKHARVIAREEGLTFINSRDHPQVLAGYATLGLEILDQAPFVDAVIVPVGTGGLLAAIATVVKQMKPSCLVYGVQSEANPVLFRSLHAREPEIIPMSATQADSIAVPYVGVNSFHIVQPLVDKMLVVKEDCISRAILHLQERERFVVEGAGACPLAAIIGNLVPELMPKNVVCILSGGNIDNLLFGRCLDRALALEGRMIKFRVGIPDSTIGNEQLLNLLAKGGYNVLRQFRGREWVDDDVYNVEMRLVCETQGLQHAMELKRMLEKAYPCTTIFETEPFNDRKTCPCFVWKSMCS